MEADGVPSIVASNPWHKRFSMLLRLALLAIAVLVLRRELDGVKVADLVAALRAYGLGHLALGLTFTVASFLTLGVFELLALRYVGKRAERVIPRRTAFATAFIAHAYSQSVGLALLTGTAVRVRSYSRYGLNGLDVARLSVFVTVTATLGLLATGGLAFLTMPSRVSFMGVAISLTPLGILLLLPIVGYIAWSAFGRAEFHGRGRWRIRRPAFWWALAQISIASLDWVLAGTVLYFLLPPSLVVSYSGFLGIYLVSQTAAVLSHVPGGVGVFEAIVISLLTVPGEGRSVSPALAASLAGSLFIYRMIYYVLPLGAAIAFSGMAELMRSRRPTNSTQAVAFGELQQDRTAPDAI